MDWRISLQKGSLSASTAPCHSSAGVLQLTLKAGRSRMHHGCDALTPLTAGRAQQLPALLRRGAGHSQGSPTVWADV